MYYHSRFAKSRVKIPEGIFCFRIINMMQCCVKFIYVQISVKLAISTYIV